MTTANLPAQPSPPAAPPVLPGAAPSSAVPVPPVAVPEPIARSQRSLAPDLARGVMLLLIALANVSFYLWGRPLDGFGNLADASTADRVAFFLQELLVAERTRPMFAVLYGFGIGVMAARMWQRHVPRPGVIAVLTRRGVGLVVLGALHGVLLFGGDILGTYGVTGLIALAFVHMDLARLRRWTWITGTFVVLVSTSLLAFLGSGAIEMPDAGSGHPGGTSYLSWMLFGGMAEMSQLMLAAFLVPFVPLVLVGIQLCRSGWLDRPGAHLPQLRRTFVVTMVVNVLSSLPVALVGLGVWEPSTAAATAAHWLTQTGGMVAGVGYVCGFALLAHRLTSRGAVRADGGRRGVVGAVTALGERSLTGYLLQSVVMAPLLAPWGLALGEGLGYLAAYGIAVGAWLVTVAVAVVLERRGSRGPFEVLLRRFTYGRAAMSAKA